MTHSIKCLLNEEELIKFVIDCGLWGDYVYYMVKTEAKIVCNTKVK